MLQHTVLYRKFSRLHEQIFIDLPELSEF